jgi:hypothetical protein
MDLLLHYQQNSIVPVLCIKEKVSYYFFSLLEVMVSRYCSVLVYKFYACTFPITLKKNLAKFRCGQRWREPNDVGVGKFLLPRRLVLRHRCQHRSLAHSDMAFLQCTDLIGGPCISSS